jgi:hypothetical protein
MYRQDPSPAPWLAIAFGLIGAVIATIIGFPWHHGVAVGALYPLLFAFRI